ncbi:SIR2 family protein [Rhizobium bangladeshense]|uniref:SIR2 family protein n=1 Tax=Rhizobium bangladeshense TaxID=1138189 RepID=UPI001FEE555A|nr:SIR2 family protein [Rhizobium bangladeshense]
MRFNEHGPDIPDELLVARDEGNVLFFCGAGVSLAYAGLADFLKLAGDVIDELGSLTGSQARRLHDAASTKLPSGTKSFVPADRMFSSLDLEFDPREVRDAVARALKPKPNVDLLAHRTLIDLSRGSDGRPRLITTNFDLLFEACDPSMKSWGPSNLPVPERPADFEGVIHVHGRVDEGYTGISDAVVLSSGEFGKAYLSDGWATHYIRRLMNRFTIVFVGYSADDPPVQYLLEALREEQSPITNIYAFQYGDEVDAQEQWLQKGVVPIAFGSDYDNLWDTLKAWADRARDLEAWYHQTMVEASSGPSKASPILRGRIAHMASTVAGMVKLTSSNPPLPSTWLYAFDPEVRYLKPQRLERNDPNSGEFDPFEQLGLDRDEPPPPIDPDDHFQERQMPTSAWNAFVPNRRDLIDVSEREIGSISAQSAVVPRLWNLAILVVKRMGEAPALWWAAGQRSVHPNLAFQLEQGLRYRLRDDSGKLPIYWRYLLSIWKKPNHETDQAALEIQQRAARAGWSPGLVREAVELCRPLITVRRAAGVAPPMTADADPANFITLDVKYPRPHVDFDFDATNLPLAVSLWRALLVEAEHMEKEIGAWVSLDTTRPDDGQRLSADSYGLTGPLRHFTHLLEALEACNPEAASREVNAWDGYDGLVFERLRIWAAGRRGLTSIQHAESVLMNINDETFWSSRHERDLLFAIKDRWSEMSDGARSSIEARLLTSPIPYLADTEPEAAEVRVAIERLNTLHWFAENGIIFGFDLNAAKLSLLKIAPTWREEFADYTAQPKVSGVFSITTDTDPTSILGVPVNQLLPIELPERRGRDYKEHDPFAGYSAARPAHSVLALHSAMRRQVNTAWYYWSTFLRSTSKMKTSARLDSVVIVLIHSLPPDEIAKLWYPLVEWLSSRAAQLEARRLGEFDIIWDKVVAAAELHPSGYKQKPGRDWSFESLNSVVGRLVLALMDMSLPDGQNSVPAQWISRLTKVLKLPGDHGRHALHLVAQRTSWLRYYEPAWTDAYVLSKATVDGPDGDAFWSGFARMGRVPDRALIKQLKPSMLSRIGRGGQEEHNLIGYLLSGWGAEGPDQIVSDAELRDVLVRQRRSAYCIAFRQRLGIRTSRMAGSRVAVYEQGLATATNTQDAADVLRLVSVRVPIAQPILGHTQYHFATSSAAIARARYAPRLPSH